MSIRVLCGEQSPRVALEGMVQPILDNHKFGLDSSFQDVYSSQYEAMHIEQCLLKKFLG